MVIPSEKIGGQTPAASSSQKSWIRHCKVVKNQEKSLDNRLKGDVDSQPVGGRLVAGEGDREAREKEGGSNNVHIVLAKILDRY